MSKTQSPRGVKTLRLKSLDRGRARAQDGQTRAQTHWVQAHRRRDDAARARLRRTLHLPRVRVEGKGTPGIGGEGGARARPEPPPCLLLLRARRRWRGMRFGCCAPGTANATTTLNAERIDVRVSGRPRESLSVGRRRTGEPATRCGLAMTIMTITTIPPALCLPHCAAWWLHRPPALRRCKEIQAVDWGRSTPLRERLPARQELLPLAQVVQLLV